MMHMVGYFAKSSAIPPDWSGPRLADLCSVSTCLGRAPDGWFECWKHNELGFFNTIVDARSVLPSDSRVFVMFAYRLLGQRFVAGRHEVLEVPVLPVELLPPGFTTLGFDVVNKSQPCAFFECSPLSCNDLAKLYKVNRYCLLSTLAEAMVIAERFSREEPEPGPYYVFEVFREHGVRASAEA